MASAENHEVNITSPASLQPPAASQIKLNGDMSWYHTANQVETNFPTLNNFLKLFEKKDYTFPKVQLWICTFNTLKWQNLSEVIAFHLKQFKGFLQ